MTVKYAQGATADDILSIESDFGLSIIRKSATGYITYALNSPHSTIGIYEILHKNRLVQNVELNYYGKYCSSTNDPHYGDQWHLDRINWSYTPFLHSVVVAVLDSGIRWEHEDLRGNMWVNEGEDQWTNIDNPTTGNGIDDDQNGFVDDWRGWDFFFDTNDPREFTIPNHASRVAGVLGAETNNNIGIASVAGGINGSGVRIMNMKVGSQYGPTVNAVEGAIIYAVHNGARIINMSFTFDTPSQAVNDAILYAANEGVVLVAAAGDSGGVEWPASNSNVIAVSGTNNADALDNNSSFGNEVDIAAPMRNVLTTGDLPGNYVSESGTSFASPQVCGVITALYSVYPCLTPDEVKTVLFANADKVGGYDYNWNSSKPGHSIELGYGRLNYGNTLNFDPSILMPGTPTDTWAVSSDVTLNDWVESRHIRVKTGATLTIEGVLQMPAHGIITVERGARLYVNGGTIKTARICYGDVRYWGGIYVLGNSVKPQPNDPFALLAMDDPGVVILRYATIELARHAISTRNPECLDCWSYFGGLVDAMNTTFLDCYRSSEFMKYDIPNKSRFENCTFKNNLTGPTSNLGAISIWDTDGIVFDNCFFGNMIHYAIQIYDAGCIVKNGNSFFQNGRAIQSLATSPISSGEPLKVGRFGGAPNLFVNNYWWDIELRSSNLYKNAQIADNQFISSSAGIWIDGRNSAFITNNYFSDKDFISVGGQFADDGMNNIYCNSSNNAWLSVLFEGNNQRTKIQKNVFESTLADIYLSEKSGVPGSLNPSQGDYSYPARNCFTTQAEHIYTEGQTHHFNYFVPNTFLPCETPVPSTFGTNNYTAIETTFPLWEDCAILEEEEEEIYGFTDYTSVKQQHSALLSQLDSDPGNVQLQNEVLRKEEEKEEIVAWFVRDAINNGNLLNADTILDIEGTAHARRLKYGIRVNLNDYTGAANILNTLPTISQDDQWFVSVQEINLERLQNPLTYELTATHEAILSEVAYSKSSERGYARALLSLLKGTQFLHDFDGPTFDRNANPVSATFKSFEIGEQFGIQPNPARGNVQVIFTQNTQEPISISISALNGHVLKIFHFDNADAYTLSLEGLQSGLYIIQAKSADKLLGHSKLVIQK